MLPPRFQSLDDVQIAVLDLLLSEGVQTAPRGVPALECRAVTFTLLHTRRRCILNSARRWSLPLALGELCWHLSASTLASELAYYAPAWKCFADAQGRIVGSCYGAKIFHDTARGTPWALARHLLQADLETRRAVLYFDDTTSHLVPECPDAACANSLQFLLRDGKLDAIVAMRSNDVIWGLPYDVFLFTFLQELMARELGCQLGAYHHFAASLHLYDRHRDLACSVLKSVAPVTFTMPSLKTPQVPDSFLEFERSLRDQEHPPFMDELDDYWQELALVLRLYHTSRDIGWNATLQSSPSTQYLPVLRPLQGG
jgi:thymidylate synthase